MRGILFVLLLLAWSSGMVVRAQFMYPAHFNVELKDPEDQAFMDQVQLRAGQWLRSNYRPVFDWQGNYLMETQRWSLDSLDLVSSGTWQLSLSRSADYDTLALAGFTKSFLRPRIFFYSGPYGSATDSIDAPRYILPLDSYHKFLSGPELDRVTSIVENELMSIATNQYDCDGHSISSFLWHWNDSHAWPLFTPDLARSSVERWSLDSGRDVYAAPDARSAILPSAVEARMQNIDTTYSIYAGDTTYHHIGSFKHISALEFMFQPEPMNWEYDGYGWNGYRTYSTTCHWIGLTFYGEAHSAIWMTEDDLVKASCIPLLKGWLDAVFANELAKRLTEE